MLKNRIEKLMKFNTEFGGAADGGAEPLTEEVETPEEDIDEPGAEPGDDSQEVTEEVEAESIDYTKEVSKRIRKEREKATREAEARFAERERQLIEDLSPNKNNEHVEFLQAQGQVNPYTGQLIDSIGEYRAYKAAYENETKASQPVNVEALVAEKVNNALKQQTVEQSAIQQMNADIAKIGKVNPAIKTAKDIENLPEASEILEKVQRGYSVFDAYVTTVKNQKPRPKDSTTGHMVPTGGNPGGGGAIPNDVLQEYKRYGMTEKEAIADYQKRGNGK